MNRIASSTTEPDTAARVLARSPNRRRPMIMHHRWEKLLFLHWRMPPARIQETLPPGLTVDTFDGDAYIGISPFFMVNVRPTGLPPLPWLSYFLELNVRTYAFDRDGTPGVWFYSLNCDRAPAVLAARAVTALPYFWCQMRARRAEWIDYSCRRRGTRESATYRYRANDGDREAELDSLEFFLLERYYLFAFRRATGNLLRGQVAHAPYRYHDVDLAEFSAIPAHVDGFPEISGTPDHACVVDGFDVNVFAQERV